MAQMSITFTITHDTTDPDAPAHVTVGQPYEWFACSSLEDAGACMAEYVTNRMARWQDSNEDARRDNEAHYCAAHDMFRPCAWCSCDADAFNAAADRLKRAQQRDAIIADSKRKTEAARRVRIADREGVLS